MVLGLLGAALAAWQWLAGKPAAPPVALPDREPGVKNSSPAVSFVEATAALDRVLGYLRDTGRYGTDQAAAARVLRAATVEAATPAVNHSVIPKGSPEARA
jgi:hypothetical protein